MDRQWLLPSGSPADIDAAVERVVACLWQGGGCVAQCEFGAGARPENVERMFEAWERVVGA